MALYHIEKWNGKGDPDAYGDDWKSAVPGSFGNERDAKETLHRLLRKEHDALSQEEKDKLNARDLDIGDWYRIRRQRT